MFYTNTVVTQTILWLLFYVRFARYYKSNFITCVQTNCSTQTVCIYQDSVSKLYVLYTTVLQVFSQNLTRNVM